MRVEIERSGEVREISFSGSVGELLAQLGVNPEEVIVARGDELLLEEDVVGGNDVVRILSVVSGG